MSEIVLYDYWRSSASYRVRIALNLLGRPHSSVSVNLLDHSHRSEAHLQRNPQGLVPVLDVDGVMLTQSLAIIEYLAETQRSKLLPADPLGRHRVRALSHAIAMDIHPICNMGVAAHVMKITGAGEEARGAWMRKFIGEGLHAFERMLDHPLTAAYCHGDGPTMADVCLVPQVYNAERWGVELASMPRVSAIAERCRALPAFAAAHPDAVKPA
ncbi:maleylacetoacetate isomerase [Sinorhizobium sp. BJ1]|nr:maleylacetoacetate isomerase [Sinorhizobium sp. BJ1]